jgi:hypothetical protein
LLHRHFVEQQAQPLPYPSSVEIEVARRGREPLCAQTPIDRAWWLPWESGEVVARSPYWTVGLVLLVQKQVSRRQIKRNIRNISI